MFVLAGLPHGGAGDSPVRRAGAGYIPGRGRHRCGAARISGYLVWSLPTLGPAVGMSSCRYRTGSMRYQHYHYTIQLFIKLFVIHVQSSIQAASLLFVICQGLTDIEITPLTSSSSAELNLSTNTRLDTCRVLYLATSLAAPARRGRNSTSLLNTAASSWSGQSSVTGRSTPAA